MMSNWQKVLLGKLAEFRNGINYNKENFGEGLKVINVKDFQDYSFATFDELDEINPDGIVREESLLKNNDIIFVRSNGNRDLIGRSLFIKNCVENITHSAFSIRLRFKSESSESVEPLFYAYLFRTSFIRKTLSSHGTVTNISNLNQGILSNLEVPLPPLPTQQKIASILLAYDELIENNARQIKILEEMAQLIYREWFVKFKFPGHENVLKVESELGLIPEGWEVVPFSNLAKLVKSSINPLNFEKEIFIHFSIPAFSNNCMPVYEKGTDIKSNKYVLPDNCVLISKINPRIQRIWQPFWDKNYRAISSTEFLVLIPQLSITSNFLFNLLKSSNFYDSYSSLAYGTSSSHQRVKPDALMNLKVVMPKSKEIIKKFDQLVNYQLTLINILRQENFSLKKTRDLLLPKLISGKIDLKKLNIKIEENVT